MDLFQSCQLVNQQIEEGDEASARNDLIKILDYCRKNDIAFDELINHFIRKLGLYPYIQTETSSWQERIVYDAFKADVGDEEQTLHREQSSVLSKLLEGRNLAISAPTSFGKSFIIDSFIAINKPKTVVIIVPTIALTDETRRRLHKKFSSEYKIITTADVELGEKNILIFPQERSISYIEKLESIDILIIDEFYKASPNFDKERSPSLLRAILHLGKVAKQRYFLAPNISDLKASLFTKGMEFISLNFNTVYLQQHELYKEINGDKDKNVELLKILKNADGKTLVYAGTFTNIKNISTLLLSEDYKQGGSTLTETFSDWLSNNYAVNWNLTRLVNKSTGIHNGQLHRSLTQIQVKLFEVENGLKSIISTSSIIEGVNTSAENVVLWSNQSGKGRAKINDFTYKNIIGRGGRMFKHFVGNIYILEEPPSDSQIQLDIPLTDEVIGDVDSLIYENELTSEQVAKIIAHKESMANLLGEIQYEALIKQGAFQNSDSKLIFKLASEIKANPDAWAGIGYLNSDSPSDWSGTLYKALNQKNVAGVPYSKFVPFVQILSRNWSSSIPELLSELEEHDLGIEEFFKLERNVSFALTALLGDINILNNVLLNDDAQDISSFVSKASHSFLPQVVYELEEYGLPRMLSRKIQNAGIIDFEDDGLKIHDVINLFNDENLRRTIRATVPLHPFDNYILDYFYDGISLSPRLAGITSND